MATKNFRKIPAPVRAKLEALKSDGVLVGCIRRIDDADLPKFARLGLPIPAGAEKTIKVVPPEAAGKFSFRNVNGEEIIRRDLPKETHYNYIEAPDWGDWSNGTHEVALPYEAYPRDFIPPRNTAISIELVSAGTGASVYKFLADEIVKKADQKRLLECINLIQENVGAVDIYPSDQDFSQYLQTLQIAWEILPPGERDRVFARILGGRSVPPEQAQRIEERYAFLISLKPEKIVVGSSGMSRYLGGMLRPNFVLFENVEYGNAIYAMYDDWAELSQRSRLDLLSGRFGQNFDRVVHTPGWKQKVKELIKQRLN